MGEDKEKFQSVRRGGGDEFAFYQTDVIGVYKHLGYRTDVIPNLYEIGLGCG